MRRSLAALGCGLALALTVGCGGGGGGGNPQSSKPAELDPTASIPGPNDPLPMPMGPAFLPGDALPPIQDDAPRMAKARQQIDTLNQAVLQYISKHKAAPPSLEVMAQPIDGQTPYFDPVLLLDPWGFAIHYDAKGPMNKHKQPDIWSIGSLEGMYISNWSDKPTPPPPAPPMPGTPTSSLVLPPN